MYKHLKYTKTTSAIESRRRARYWSTNPSASSNIFNVLLAEIMWNEVPEARNSIDHDGEDEDIDDRATPLNDDPDETATVNPRSD